MSRLIESIRLFNGKFERLELHQARLNNSFQTIFRKNPGWSLQALLQNQDVPQSGLYKCRIVYDDQHQQVEFKLYKPSAIKTLKRVADNTIDYQHKWENRDQLNNAFSKRGDCDDILIVRNGLITDSLYANVAFQKAGKWYTPQSCLLAGTMRQFLLNTGVISEKEITEETLREFEACKLINAMLGWDGPTIDISNIY